jgi:hypothetical protein
VTTNLSVDELKQPGLIKTNGDGDEDNNDEEITICELPKHNFRSNLATFENNDRNTERSE